MRGLPRGHLAHNEWVAGLEGDELVEVEQDIKEDAGQALLALEVLQREDALHSWLHHVVDLA